jgi:hypothetical protein
MEQDAIIRKMAGILYAPYAGRTSPEQSVQKAKQLFDALHNARPELHGEALAAAAQAAATIFAGQPHEDIDQAIAQTINAIGAVYPAKEREAGKRR